MKIGARDTAIAFSSKAAVLLLGVAVQSALAWLLGPGGRGAYAVCLLYATLLGTVFTFGVDRAGQYMSVSGRMTPPEGFWATMATLLVGSALAMCVGFALLGLDLAFFERAERASFLIAIGMIPFHVLQRALVMQLIARRLYWQMAFATVISIVVQLLATLLLIGPLALGPSGALLAVLAAGVVTIVVSVLALREEAVLPVPRLRRSHIGMLLSYGIRYYGARLSNMVHFRVGTMVLAFFAGSADVGLFAAISGVVTRVLIIPDAIETALITRVAVDSRGRPELVGQAARVSGIVSGLCLALLVGLGPIIVRVLLSPSFAPAQGLIWIMAIGVFVRASAKVIMSYFMGTDRPAICSISVVVGTIVNVLALLALLPVLGLVGAAWAMALGYISSSAILVVAFSRVSRIPFTETWIPRRSDVSAILGLLEYLRLRRPGGPRGSLSV